MGIPHYFHTITKTYPGILHFRRPVQPDAYFLDFNGVIHPVVREVLQDPAVQGLSKEDMERHMYDKIWEYTERCASIAQPQELLGIYIDGVAPVAKIQQQRKRRYMSVLRHRMLGTHALWDTNAISPGTAFMTRLHAFLRQKIRQDAMRPAGFFQLSSAEDSGEGEHKIFAHIATMPAHKKIFIHGLDADLIMLSLLSHHPNLVLMREPSYPYTAESTEDGFLYVDIDRLREGILRHLDATFGWPVAAAALEDVYSHAARSLIETYVVCCFLLGNDFLPHPAVLSLSKKGYDRVLQSARGAWQMHPEGAVQRGQVCMAFLATVLGDLAKEEDAQMWKANQDYLRKEPRADAEDPLDAFPLQPDHKDPLAQKIFATPHSKQRWRALYYKHLFFVRMHDTRIVTHACRTFLEGVCWTYAYYKRLPKPWDWYYPYGYAPSLLDLSNHLQGTPTSAWEDMQQAWRTEHSTPRFLEPAVQLLCILPRESTDLIPYRYQKYAADPRFGMAYMYPTWYPLQTYLHTHMWECHPLLPPLDIPWILACIEAGEKRT